MDIDEGADRDAGVLAGRPLPRAVAEALADPIVRSLMAADGIDEAALRRLLGRMVVRLASGLGIRDEDSSGADYSAQANEPCEN
jgi:hypothetical protein